MRHLNMFIGKVIERVDAGEMGDVPLQWVDMVEEVTFHFEDGDKLTLCTDWRGRDCYISEKEK